VVGSVVVEEKEEEVKEAAEDRVMEDYLVGKKD
jgi:hypothetical protein